MSRMSYICRCFIALRVLWVEYFMATVAFGWVALYSTVTFLSDTCDAYICATIVFLGVTDVPHCMGSSEWYSFCIMASTCIGIAADSQLFCLHFPKQSIELLRTRQGIHRGRSIGTCTWFQIFHISRKLHETALQTRTGNSG